MSSSSRSGAGVPSSRSGGLPAALREFAGAHVSFLIFAVIAALACASVPNFAQADNFAVVVRQSAIPIIACIGMTMVLMTGGIDLSLGYIVGLSSIVSGILAKNLLLPAPLVLAVVLGLGALIGLANGAIIQFGKVPAFITTLGSGYILYGVAQIVSQGSIVNRLPAAFLAIGRTSLLGLPSSVFIALLVAGIFQVLIGSAAFGRRLRAFGFGPKAAGLSGVPVARINVSVYCLCGALAALAGLLLTIRVNAAQPNMGGGTFTFEAVTAAIVGGTSLFGGVGSVVGSIFGVLTIKIIENCINLLGVSYHLYLAVQGVIILAAIVLGNLAHRRG